MELEAKQKLKKWITETGYQSSDNYKFFENITDRIKKGMDVDLWEMIGFVNALCFTWKDTFNPPAKLIFRNLGIDWICDKFNVEIINKNNIYPFSYIKECGKFSFTIHNTLHPDRSGFECKRSLRGEYDVYVWEK